MAARSLSHSLRACPVSSAELARADGLGQVIAYLDTGAGKTLISVLLVKDKVSRLLDQVQPRRVVLFLAPKVDLVLQQADVLKLHTEVAVAAYVGDMGCDFWSKDTWRRSIEKNEVLVMTPQILLNILRHGFLQVRQC